MRNLRPGKLTDLLEDTKLIKNSRGRVNKKIAFGTEALVSHKWKMFPYGFQGLLNIKR